MNRFDKWLTKSRWLALPLLYVIVCVSTYYSTNIIIEGIELPRREAGVYGVIGLHVMGFVAGLGAYILHVIVELIAKLFK